MSYNLKFSHIIEWSIILKILPKDLTDYLYPTNRYDKSSNFIYKFEKNEIIQFLNSIKYLFYTTHHHQILVLNYHLQ